MLSKLLENLLTDPSLRLISSSEIRPTEELRVHLFNDDQLKNHRLQIIDSTDVFQRPGLPENEFQNPSAHLGEVGTPDGLYACLASVPRQPITCDGGTPSAYVDFLETDLFDIVIGNASYTNVTFEQLTQLLKVQQVDIVPMTTRVMPPVKPFVFTARNPDGINDVIAFESRVKVEVLDHPEIQLQRDAEGWFITLPTSDELYNISVIPADGVSPLSSIDFSHTLVDIISWCETGHDNSDRYVPEQNQYFQRAGRNLVSVPDTLHPSITSLAYLFSDSTVFNQDISNWDVSKVTDMSGAFKNAAVFNQSLSTWNISNVTNLAGMFHNAKLFNSDLNTWNVSKVTDMTHVFDGAESFNGIISGWNVSNVTNMAYMFHNAKVFNRNISNWNISKVKNIEYMFAGTKAFNIPLNDWVTSSVENMNSTFEDASVYAAYLGDWDVSKVTSMDNMFHNATLYNQDLFNWCVANVLTKPPLFETGSSLQPLQLPIWGTCPSPDLSLQLPPMDTKIVGDLATINLQSPIEIRTIRWTLSDPSLADLNEDTLVLTFKKQGILTISVNINNLLDAEFTVQINPRVIVRAPYNLALQVLPADNNPLV